MQGGSLFLNAEDSGFAMDVARVEQPFDVTGREGRIHHRSSMQGRPHVHQDVHITIDDEEVFDSDEHPGEDGSPYPDIGFERGFAYTPVKDGYAGDAANTFLWDNSRSMVRRSRRIR